MIRVEMELRPVWRSAVGRKGRLTRRAAYLDAAWQAWRAKYWPVGCGCGCELETFSFCEYHGPDGPAPELVKERRRVVDRLARWLMWRDGHAGRRSRR
jgi:hypothetical protein